MRFMTIMMPKGYENAKPGTVPDVKAIETMRKYNEQLQKAGVLLALDGLTPPSMCARVTFKGGKSKITDGPFPEAKEVVGGFWIIEVKSREEALEWASRIPGADNETVEVRRLLEITDFDADVSGAHPIVSDIQRQTKRQHPQCPHPSCVPRANCRAPCSYCGKLRRTKAVRKISTSSIAAMIRVRIASHFVIQSIRRR